MDNPGRILVEANQWEYVFVLIQYGEEALGIALRKMLAVAFQEGIEVSNPRQGCLTVGKSTIYLRTDSSVHDLRGHLECVQRLVYPYGYAVPDWLSLLQYWPRNPWDSDKIQRPLASSPAITIEMNARDPELFAAYRLRDKRYSG